MEWSTVRMLQERVQAGEMTSVGPVGQNVLVQPVWQNAAIPLVTRNENMCTSKSQLVCD